MMKKNRWKRYPKYKNSGIEWLGEVPEGWKILVVKRIVSNHKQGYYTSDEYVDHGVKLLRITDIDDFSNVDYSQCPYVQIGEKEKTVFSLQKGDFVFARSGTIGRFGVIKKKEDIVFASYLIKIQI